MMSMLCRYPWLHRPLGQTHTNTHILGQHQTLTEGIAKIGKRGWYGTNKFILLQLQLIQMGQVGPKFIG